MKPLQIKLLWLLIFTNLHIEVQLSSLDIFIETSDLSELCPYTSFCGQNASSAFPFSEEYQPCCRSCSCHPDCGLHGDCCFSHLDQLYSERPPVVCRSGFLDEPPEEEFPEALIYRFRMVKECRYTITGLNMNETACEKLSPDPLQAFYPVVSISTGFVYINKLCGLCNNVSDTVPWRRAVTCNPLEKVLLSEYFTSFTNLNSSAMSGCYMFYIPPLGFDISPSPSCSPVVVRTCTEYFVNQSSKTLELCEKFNATFAVRMNKIERLYANIYCYLCNMEGIGSSRPAIQNKHCLKFGNLIVSKGLSESRLTVLLDSANINISPVKTEEEESACPINYVPITSLKNTCRQVRCPWGQILLNNRCGYYSNMWIGGPFSILLRLTPVEKTAYIPRSFFEDLPESFRNDKHAMWIKRRSLRRWKFLVLYHPYEDTQVIDYIIIRATYEATSVDPNNLNTLLKRALDETWQIYHLNSSYELKVDIDEYLKYDNIYRDTLATIGINVTVPFGIFPSWVSCDMLSVRNNYYRELLLPLTTYTTSELSAGFVISKLFFCDQVDLLYDEYDYKCSYVHFRVKNTIIYTFDVVKPRGSNETAKELVRVCLHEFDNIQNGGYTPTIQFIMLFTKAYVSFLICWS